MRLAKWFCLAALILPFTFAGCSEESSEVATDAEFLEYSNEAAEGSEFKKLADQYREQKAEQK